MRMEERKIQIADAGDRAMSVIRDHAALAANGTLPEAEARRQALARIRALRYGDAGYVLVIDSQAILMHPIQAALAGTPVRAIRDAAGRPMCEDALASVRATGKGYTTFLWAKPGSTQPERKLSYNARYTPWDWTVMTGLYVDDVDTAFRRSLAADALLLALVGAALTALVLAIVRSIERSVGGPLEHATQVARRIAAATWIRSSTPGRATRRA